MQDLDERAEVRSPNALAALPAVAPTRHQRLCPPGSNVCDELLHIPVGVKAVHCVPRPRRPRSPLPRWRSVTRTSRRVQVRSLWFNPLVRGLRHGARTVGLASGLTIGAVTACGGGGGGPSAADAPHFVADSGGIDHRYEGDFQYFVGGGVAAFDCDDDGRSELFFAGGSAPAALYHNESPTGGALRFAPLPSPVTDLTDVTGAYPLDVDGDEHTDLAVLRVGEDVLLRGPRRLLVRASQRRTRHRWRGHLDRRLQRDVGGRQRPAHAGVRRLPGADRESCEDSRLLRPDARRRWIRRADRPRRPATARCRCCSATGAARAAATCG